MGNRVYLPCLYVYNKCDITTIEECDRLAREPHSVVCRFEIAPCLSLSCLHCNLTPVLSLRSVNMKLNLEYLRDKIWEYLALIGVYTKRSGGWSQARMRDLLLQRPQFSPCFPHPQRRRTFPMPSSSALTALSAMPYVVQLWVCVCVHLDPYFDPLPLSPPCLCTVSSHPPQLGQ